MAHSQQTSSSRYQVAAVGMCLETLLADRSTKSPTDFARVAEAAATAGFRSVAITAGRAAQLGVQDARRILDDAGLEVKLAELVTYWAEGPDAAINDFEDQLDTIEAMGAKTILAVAQQTEMDLAERLRVSPPCVTRRPARDVQVAIEFVPGRALCDLATAWQVLQRSGAPNGGIDLDMKHWQNQASGPTSICCAPSLANACCTSRCATPTRRTPRSPSTYQDEFKIGRCQATAWSIFPESSRP